MAGISPGPGAIREDAIAPYGSAPRHCCSLANSSSRSGRHALLQRLTTDRQTATPTPVGLAQKAVVQHAPR